MKTYKLGNKIKCIVRAYSKGKIGKFDIEFDNQPYTILKDVEASLTFTEKIRDSKSIFTDLAYTTENLQEVTLSNVELNDKVLNMIFSEKKHGAVSKHESLTMTEGIVYLKEFNDGEIAQVFIYNIDGELLAAAGSVQVQNGIVDCRSFECYHPTKHKSLTEEIIIFYCYEKDCFKFKREDKNDENRYFILDLILEGNTEEYEEDTPTNSFIHIGKCAVRVNKNMYFNRTLNAVDLKFIVVDNVIDNDRDNESYIILEQ
jgi:hypothetical protein